MTYLKLLALILTRGSSNQSYYLKRVFICSCEAHELNIKEYTADNNCTYVFILIYHMLHVLALVIVRYTYIYLLNLLHGAESFLRS